MNFNEIKKGLQECDAQTKEIIQKEVSLNKDFIHSNFGSLLTNIDPKLDVNFGKFLGTVFNKLHYKKCTKIFSSIKELESYKAVERQAKEKKMSIEEFIKANNTHINNITGEYSFASIKNGFEFAKYDFPRSLGRFRNSHLNSSIRIHSSEINPNKLFTYITKEHAELIIDSNKRKCVSELVDFRDRYLATAKGINEKVFEFEKPLIAKRFIIEACSIHSNCENVGTYNNISNIVDFPIKSITVMTCNDFIKNNLLRNLRKDVFTSNSTLNNDTFEGIGDICFVFTSSEKVKSRWNGEDFQIESLCFNKDNYTCKLKKVSNNSYDDYKFISNFYNLLSEPNVMSAVKRYCNIISNLHNEWRELMAKHAGLMFLYGKSI